MADFKVDTDAFQTAISKYDSEIQNINNIKNNINKILINLKDNGWNSEAGEASLKEFEALCTDNIDKYMNIAETLKDVLSQSGSDFENLANEISKLECKY